MTSMTERAAANVRRFAGEGAVALLTPIGTTSSMGVFKAANEVKVHWSSRTPEPPRL